MHFGEKPTPPYLRAEEIWNESTSAFVQLKPEAGYAASSPLPPQRVPEPQNRAHSPRCQQAAPVRLGSRTRGQGTALSPNQLLSPPDGNEAAADASHRRRGPAGGRETEAALPAAGMGAPPHDTARSQRGGLGAGSVPHAARQKDRSVPWFPFITIPSQRRRQGESRQGSRTPIPSAPDSSPRISAGAPHPTAPSVLAAQEFAPPNSPCSSESGATPPRASPHGTARRSRRSPAALQPPRPAS